jgi:hypothetical protein
MEALFSVDVSPRGEVYCAAPLPGFDADWPSHLSRSGSTIGTGKTDVATEQNGRFAGRRFVEGI